MFHRYPYGTAHFPAYNVTVAYSFIDTFDSLKTNRFSDVMVKYAPFTTNDVLHFNIGVHYHANYTKYHVDMLRFFSWTDTHWPAVAPILMRDYRYVFLFSIC
jgi:hypothetical protein